MKESGETMQFTAETSGERLDRWLAALMPDFSRSRLGKMIEAGLVLVDDKPAKASHKMVKGQSARVSIPEAEPDRALPEDIALDIIYEDKWFIAVAKPAGLVVHPAPGHWTGTLVNALLHSVSDLSGVGGVLRPGIVHRLDKDTSGVMLVAKDDAAHQAIQKLFKDKALKKTYLAIALGRMVGEGVLTTNIGRHPSQRKKMAAGVSRGRAATTSWKVVKALDGATLLEVVIETGRTHQIRVHLASIGHPVAGDQVYGGAAARGGSPKARAAVARLTGQALHAWKLEFVHPMTGEALVLEAPVTACLEAVLRELGG